MLPSPFFRILVAALPLTLLTACGGARAPQPKTAAPAETAAAKPGGEVVDKAKGDGMMVKASDSAVQDLRQRVIDCYQRALTDDPSTEGELYFSLAVAQDGNVVGAKVNHRGTCGEPFIQCISGVLRSLRFEPPPGGELATIEGKLTFLRSQ